MKKLLYFIPLTLLFLISCDSTLFGDGRRCDRKETRTITNIFFNYNRDFSQPNATNFINLNREYESYFVNKYGNSKLQGNYSLSINLENCFEGYSNEILTVSIKSLMDFSSSYRTGSELNSLFYSYFSDKPVSESDFNQNGYRYYESTDNLIPFYTQQKPSLDSIHTLIFTVRLADGQLFYDSLQNVNLNRTLRRL